MGFHQPAYIIHLQGSRQVQCVIPIQVRAIDTFFYWRIHLPDIMTAIGMAMGTCKQIEVSKLAYIIGIGCSQVLYVKTNRVIFINRLCIHNWFGRLHGIYGLYFVINRDITAMTVLKHIKTEPLILMKPLGRALRRWLWVKTNKGFVCTSFLNGLAHRLPYRCVFFISRIAIAS